jgi:hypothetical protein
MTKRNLIKYLEQKMDEKRRAVESDYTAACEREKERVFGELGLPALADKMQLLLQQAHDLWNDWKAKNESYEGLKINNYYYALIFQLTASTDSEDATYKKLTVEHIEFDSKMLESMKKQYRIDVERVIMTFSTVISTVQQMKHTKEAAVYLKELGFDLSELENPVNQAQTALMVPVDTNYLFVKAA